MERIMPCGNEGKWTVPLTMCIKGIRRLWWAINKNLWLFSKPPPAKNIRTCNGMANQETCLRQCMRKLKAYRGRGTSPLPQGKNHLCKMGIGLVKVCDGNKEWFKKTDFIKKTGPNWMRFWTVVFIDCSHLQLSSGTCLVKLYLHLNSLRCGQETHT